MNQLIRSDAKILQAYDKQKETIVVAVMYRKEYDAKKIIYTQKNDKPELPVKKGVFVDTYA